MAILQNVLTPSVVTGIVSRIYMPGNPLSRFFGGQIDGPNTKKETVLGRAYSWDIFDNVRKAAYGRQPNTGPSTIAANPVGRQTNTFARCYEKIPLDYELLNNIRAIGKNAGERDRQGASYLEAQARQLRQRHDNFREFMWGGFLTQGQYSFQFVGDDMVPVLSLNGAPGMTVNYQIPAGNLPGFTGAWQANLNPLGTGNIISAPWSNNATDIATQIDQINQAFQQLVGAPLALVITDSTVWRMVVKNTSLQAQGGSVNAVFAEYEMTEERGPDGNKLGIFRARIRAVPWLEWLIVDTGLELGLPGQEVFNRWYPGNLATFLVQPDAYWLKMVEGSELVKDNPMAPAVQRYGFHAWLREWDEPARVELHALQNAILEMRIPKAIQIARVA